MRGSGDAMAVVELVVCDDGARVLAAAANAGEEVDAVTADALADAAGRVWVDNTSSRTVTLLAWRLADLDCGENSDIGIIRPDTGLLAVPDAAGARVELVAEPDTALRGVLALATGAEDGLVVGTACLTL